jgi:hypothetical protein
MAHELRPAAAIRLTSAATDERTRSEQLADRVTALFGFWSGTGSSRPAHGQTCRFLSSDRRK